MCPPKVTFLKLPATTRIRREMMCERVYQDIVLPLRTLEDAINLSDDLFDIWPILVYPSRVYRYTQYTVHAGNNGYACLVSALPSLPSLPFLPSLPSTNSLLTCRLCADCPL